MAVQIVENWSDVTGTVGSCRPSPNVPGFVEIEIVVEQVKPVEGVANLLEHAAGKNLTVLVPEEVVKSLNITLGDKIECRVRRATLDRAFVHRNHISVRHPE
jgi:hypothetical protein